MVVPAAATRLGGVYTDLELVLAQPGKAMVMVTAYVDVGTMENRIVSVSVSAMANDLVFANANAFGEDVRPLVVVIVEWGPSLRVPPRARLDL